MRVAQLTVKNFRGIKHLEWKLMGQSICCLIGVGDSAKQPSGSTVDFDYGSVIDRLP
jgi:hypothetical protein